MRLLVTGALGHIGSQLVRDLGAAFPDAELVLLDNLSTQRYCSLFGLAGGARYRFVEADVLKADLQPWVEGADAVVHLAAITNAEGSFAIQEEVERVNLHGTERVARSCVAAGVPLLFPSTTSVYGTQSEVVDESCSEDELRPQSPYADSKLRAERLLAELGRREGLRYVTCRLGTIFGPSPGMRFHTAVNKFCWQAIVGQPLTVWRTALHQRRPYLALEDATRAVEFLLRRRQFDTEVYNVLTVNATVADIVHAIRAWVPDVQVQEVDSRIMNQLSYTVRCDKILALGFKPQGDLRRGIAETLRLVGGARYGALRPAGGNAA